MVIKFRNLICHNPEYSIEGGFVTSGELAGYFGLSNAPESTKCKLA